MFVVDVAILTMVLSIGMPIVVGLVTKEVANSKIKAALLLLFAGVTTLVNQAVTNGGVFTKETLGVGILTYVVAVATHFGFYKPTGVTEAVQHKTKNVGIG